ncbi:site-2 protease family protein [Aeoliella mucimassa]|uniref:Peptidase family M50 n=1 Tax=Aeoliella mucimassa TaxID=2527972 RepID=A0A518AIY5_9BACT|nr:site-2 protease family protein [Aeoliella mucimassa]QDU54699.1 Peptidase family M50 [Aeoliella mucimassa]
MLNEPPPSPADLHFRIAGIPVRIHPFFWLVGLFLGLGGNNRDPLFAVSWIVVLFVSILIHELGHAFMQRRFGGWPRIVLHGFGGLAICGDCDRSPRSQILISFAGPVAGFLFAAVVIGFVLLMSPAVAFVPLWQATPAGFGETMYPSWLVVGYFWFRPFGSSGVMVAVFQLLQINIVWGLVNLLPIYPLDGGQIAREVLTLGRNTQYGLELSMKISIGAAIAMAVVGLAFFHSFFIAVMFGFLAYNNFQLWQAYTGRGNGMGW